MQRVTLTLAVVLLSISSAVALGKKSSSEWQSSFNVNKSGLADRGVNKYFILEPGYKLHFKSKDGATLVIAVLDETKMVDGVKTRIVEERETSKGKLSEISRNYFAIDPNTKAVYYFGEEVDNFKNGKIDNHDGSWLAGNGNKFGLMIPANPKKGDKFYQEQAPKVAMDKAEILSTTAKLKTPAGKFKDCLHTQDSSGLESGKSEKFYAPGVGLIKDDEMVLVKIEMPEKK
jgi:hypothetical protein